MIYLDNAATTRPNEQAVLRASEAVSSIWYNPSALYEGGGLARKTIDSAREKLLLFAADSSAFELIFTSCGTEADNQAIFGAAKRGNFVTTAGEHAAVYACAQELKNRGVEVRYEPLRSDGSVDCEALLNLVDGNTSLVSVIHVNNETGAINPVAELAARIKQINPRTVFHSDGVQAFGKIPVRLTKHIDLYSVSAHKIGGLKGVGALIKRRSLSLSPYLYGGGQEGGKRSGTENVLGILAFSYSADSAFHALEENAKRVSFLREKLWNSLDKNIFFRLSSVSGTPYILSVSASGLKGEVLQRMLSDKGVYVGTGSACSSKRPHSRVMEACGHKKELLEGVLRLSFSAETTEEEIVEAARIINNVASRLQGRLK